LDSLVDNSQNAILVELLDDGLGRDANGAHEELGAAVDNYIDELVQLTLGVVVATTSLDESPCVSVTCLHILGLSRATANLRKKQVNTERRALVVEEALQLGDLLAEHVRRVTNATEHTQTSGVGHGGSKLRACCYVHAGEQHRVLDLQQVGELCADLFCALSADTCDGGPLGLAYAERPWLRLCRYYVPGYEVVMR
jgi:hypothetical protein